MKCPSCGEHNTDNWPLNIDGEIKWGGCQDCWESETDESWWENVKQIYLDKTD